MPDGAVEAWSKRIDPTDDGTTINDLLGMLRALGLTPVLNAALEYPYIALVDYAQLPKANRIDQTGRTFGHWVVRLSDTGYHDPYHARGGQVTTKAILDVAINIGATKYWRGTILKLGILEGMMTKKMTVDSPGGLNVRAWAGVAPNNKIGLLADGDEVVVIGEDVNGWKKIALVDNAKGSKVSGWVSGQYLKNAGAAHPQPVPVVTPTPNPSQREGGVRLGVNVLNDFGALREAEVSGCKFCMVMDGVSEAVNFARAHPDGYAMLRRYVGNSHWGAGDFFDGLGIAPDMPKNLIVTLFNEADTWGFQTDQLEQRMRVETEFVRLARARGFEGIIALGTFSMGTPQFAPNAPEFSETCRLINQYYAPLWNAGQIGLDYHAYSPTIEHINNAGDLFWYERRWEGFFRYCGLDPQKGQGVFFGECGLDQQGSGGFKYFNTNAEGVAAWMRKFVDAQMRPVVVDGREYPSPVRGGAVFCYGNNGDPRWRDGYDVRELGAAPFKIAGVW